MVNPGINVSTSNKSNIPESYAIVPNRLELDQGVLRVERLPDTVHPVEVYGLLYIPDAAQRMVIKVGRYISPPDIEAQLAPDNYLYTHSLMFTEDCYTQTGINASENSTTNGQYCSESTPGRRRALEYRPTPDGDVHDPMGFEEP